MEQYQLEGREADIAVNDAIETEAFQAYWETFCEDYQPRATGATVHRTGDADYRRTAVDIEARDGESHGTIVVLMDDDAVQYSEAVFEEVSDGDIDRFEEYRLIEDEVVLHTAHDIEADRDPGDLVPRDR